MVEISVIMPVYNGEEFLEESLNCISNQTFKDIEVICVDDCSTDHSLDILKDFSKKDSRFNIYHLDENKGGGHARNFALTKVRGKYLYCMDADDILKPNALQELYYIIEEKNVDFVMFKALVLDEEKKEYVYKKYYLMEPIYDIVGDEIFDFRDLEEDLIFDFCVTPWNKLYNMEFIRNSGAKFAEGLIFQDNPFFYEMLFNSQNIYFYNEILYYRRRHPQSIHGVKGKNYFDTFKIHERNQELFIKYGLFDRYKPYFYNRKVQIIHRRYTQIDETLKDSFFEEMKADFKNMIDEEGKENIDELLNERNKTILKNLFSANTRNEFDLYMKEEKLNKKIKQLKNKNKALNDTNKALNDKNKKLEEENLKLKKRNDMILSSQSWKITKPLRKFKQTFKK